MNNREIAGLFHTIADMLTLKGESIHRVMAYRNAAESIAELPRDLRAYAAEGKLDEIPHVGKIIAEKITELLETGRLDFYERLSAEIPPGVVEMLHVNGIGPKRALQFWKELQITSIAELQTAIQAGKLNSLPGMGAKSAAKIAAGIDAYLKRSANPRIRLGDALPVAERLLARLTARGDVRKGAVAGSIRRGRPTIGDIDLLVAAEDSAAPDIMVAFVSSDEVARILGQGTTKSSVELHSGLQVDLRVIAPQRWGTALSYFTGSQAHNIQLRELARQRGLSLNEHAFTRSETGEAILCDSEEAVYAVLGLPFIPPELREGQGEIERAAAGQLPTLIVRDQIRADLHMHTLWSDGKATIREMAAAARDRGHQYIVITDHSVGAAIANGLSIERLLAQADEIREVDREMRPFRVFHGSEVEIKASGDLDFPDEVLARLDFVIASLHTGLRQPREQVTARLLAAINNPHVDLIAHPRGQLIPDREGADLDMDAVFAAAQRTGTALEINSNPHRLDLEAQYARRAAELGIPIAIDTDAHSVAELDNLRYGIMTARRGWIGANSVINTWPVERFEAWIASRGSSV
jgi:DNA polymerase (family 10)